MVHSIWIYLCISLHNLPSVLLPNVYLPSYNLNHPISMIHWCHFKPLETRNHSSWYILGLGMCLYSSNWQNISLEIGHSMPFVPEALMKGKNPSTPLMKWYSVT